MPCTMALPDALPVAVAAATVRQSLLTIPIPSAEYTRLQKLGLGTLRFVAWCSCILICDSCAILCRWTSTRATSLSRSTIVPG